MNYIICDFYDFYDNIDFYDNKPGWWAYLTHLTAENMAEARYADNVDINNAQPTIMSDAKHVASKNQDRNWFEL